MNSSDFFEAVTSTSAPPVVPTNPTCDCSGRPNSTPGELTIVALSAVSVLKYIWPQIAWAWDSLISFSVKKSIDETKAWKKGGRTKTSRGASRRIRRTDAFAAPWGDLWKISIVLLHQYSKHLVLLHQLLQALLQGTIPRLILRVLKPITNCIL